MDAPATAWWEREPEAASQHDLSRDARVLIAGMCVSLGPHFPGRIPDLFDASRQATAKRYEVVRELFRRSDVAALREIVGEARSRALGSSPLGERRPDALRHLGLAEDDSDDQGGAA